MAFTAADVKKLREMTNVGIIIIVKANKSKDFPEKFRKYFQFGN